MSSVAATNATITPAGLVRFEYDGVMRAQSGSEVPATVVIGKLTNEQLEAIEAAKITGQITETQVGPEAISTPKLKAGAVTTATLAAGSVTAAKLAVAELSAISANLGTVTAGTLKAVTIESGILILPEYKEGAESGAPFLEWGGGAERIVGAKRGEVRTIELRANDLASGAGEVLLEAHGENASIVGRFAARSRLIVESKESSSVKIAVRAKNDLASFTERLVLNSAGESGFLQLSTTANRKINFGVATFEWVGGSKGSKKLTIAHGLGVAPTFMSFTPSSEGGAVLTFSVFNKAAATVEAWAFDWFEIPVAGAKFNVDWIAIG